MEYFALGFIAGVVVCTFLATVVAVFRKPIVTAVEMYATQLEAISPVRAKGFLWEPESEADEARAAKIRENAERGADTPISELL